MESLPWLGLIFKTPIGVIRLLFGLPGPVGVSIRLGVLLEGGKVAGFREGLQRKMLWEIDNNPIHIVIITTSRFDLTSTWEV